MLDTTLLCFLHECCHALQAMNLIDVLFYHATCNHNTVIILVHSAKKGTVNLEPFRTSEESLLAIAEMPLKKIFLGCHFGVLGHFCNLSVSNVPLHLTEPW